MTRIEKNSPTFRTQDASSIQGSLADFMKRAVPSDVSKASNLGVGGGKFGDDAVAFRMNNGKSVDMVWDRKSDTMYQLDRGKMIPVSDEVKNAALARLGDNSLKATRGGSLYDVMQKDMLEATKGTTTTQKQPPLPQPKADEVNPTDLYRADADEQPVVAETPVQPVEARKLTETEWLSRVDKRTVTTEGLRANGVDARQADTNGDGAIRGNEWKGVWKVIDKADKNKDAKSVNPDDRAVLKKIVDIDMTVTASPPMAPRSAGTSRRS